MKDDMQEAINFSHSLPDEDYTLWMIDTKEAQAEAEAIAEAEAAANYQDLFRSN